MTRITLTILGQPCSKANSRELATIGPKDKRRTIVRKSDAGLDYEREALRQIPVSARQRLEGPVRVTMTLFYASERPDLDGTLIRDVLQDRWARDKATKQRVLVQEGVYRNDRQVREEHYFHAIDRARPRAEILIEALQPQQSALALPEALQPADIF